jgi:hypothetical protein
MNNEIKYYFSSKTLFFMSVFIIGSITLMSFVFFKIYEDDLFWAIVFASPLLVILISLPDYLRFMYYAITGQPALILTKDSLINNANGQEYKWTDIKEISYKKFSGYEAPPGGYIEIILCGSEKKISLPNISIKCKTKELLKDLQNYLIASQTSRI